MKRSIQGIAAGLALGLASAGVAAQGFPDKPIRLMVGIGAGSATDNVARLVAKHLGTRIGQPVVVENRPGAGGTIAAEAVARSPADGYTLLWGTSSMPIFQHMYNLRFNPVKDLTAVGNTVGGAMVLLTRLDGPATVAELIAKARTKDGAVSYASAGVGSNAHLASEVLGQMAGVRFVHVPYKGSSAAYPDVITGQIDFVFDGLSAALPQIQGGRMKALAVTTPARSSFLPNIATMHEAGVPNFSHPVWLGVFAPAGVPRPVLERLSNEIVEIVRQPSFRQELVSFGVEPYPLGTDQFNALMRKETDEWEQKVKTMKLNLRQQG